MPQLDVDGATLTYDDKGPRDGGPTPLVLVHGWTANRHRRDHQMIHGFHDIQLPVRQMLCMAKAYPDAVVRIIDAGHELPVERPAALTTALDRFLTAA
ncbi:alpha/beta fold hydrolase [Streptomyces gilvus]|uniref:alpha/beta fold hydrolase n=1 Tax=Streptomyces gilvus TaxID=2920937 RepID=UPI001F11573F|nr:alpha/beta hydrolase [Streptomyces sp. CME 23]MCH5677015.1 alpha/beta hydrolase [Streptomyces sp. CME 23]